MGPRWRLPATEASTCSAQASATSCCKLGRDEIHLYVAPVLFGSGTPLFESLPRHVQLEQLGVEQTAKTTYLRYRVASV